MSAKSCANVDAVHSAANLLAHIRKRKLQIGVPGKIDDRGLIERRERVDQSVGRFAHFVRIRQDARAGVEDQRHARGLRGRVEIRNLLREAVLVNPEILAPQALHGRAVAGRYDARDRHRLRANLDRVPHNGMIFAARVRGAVC